MSGIGEALVVLLHIAAFSVMALIAGLGLAIMSIWIPITLWQAIAIMVGFGLFGNFLAGRMH